MGEMAVLAVVYLFVLKEKVCLLLESTAGPGSSHSPPLNISYGVNGEFFPSLNTSISFLNKPWMSLLGFFYGRNTNQ